MTPPLGGWLLDRFGSERVYAAGIFICPLFSLLQGFAGMMPVAGAVVTLLLLRFMVGFGEAPPFPGKAPIVAA